MIKLYPFKQTTLVLFSIQLVINGLSLFFTIYLSLHLADWQSWFHLVFIQAPILSGITESFFIDGLLFCYLVAIACIAISNSKLELIKKQIPIFMLYSILASLFAAVLWFTAEVLARHDTAIYDTLSFYILLLLMLVYIESQYKVVSKKEKKIFSVYAAIKYCIIILPAIVLLANFFVHNWLYFDIWRHMVASYFQGSFLEAYTTLFVYLSLLFPLVSVVCFICGFFLGEFMFGRKKTFFRAGFICIIFFISFAFFIARIMELRRDFSVVTSFLDRIDDQYKTSFILNYTLNHMILYLLASMSSLLLIPAKKNK